MAEKNRAQIKDGFYISLGVGAASVDGTRGVEMDFTADGVEMALPWPGGVTSLEPERGPNQVHADLRVHADALVRTEPEAGSNPGQDQP